MKLGLGTVQFGLHYGVNNATGRPNLQQIESILSLARSVGISVLDTAADYGESEITLGKTLRRPSSFKIVTKFSKQGTARESLERSLRYLGTPNVYAVLLHDFQQYANNAEYWEAVRGLRLEGLAQKIGFSLYHPSELDLLLQRDEHFDIVQIPFSVFDQRFQKHLSHLHNRGVEIHARSIFVQGLVFTKLESLHSFFEPIRDKLLALKELSVKTNKSVESLCLNFVYGIQEIDRVIIGVDTTDNLERNVSALSENLTAEERSALSALREDNEQMILPYNWKLT